jgi:hypothetical protein
MGTAGALSLATPGIVTAGIDGSKTPDGAKEKSCIFILLCGGPSHLDSWDLKPSAPAEIRGPYNPIATAVPGMRISELHQRLAKMTNRFSLIRSMTHPGNISNHFDAMHNSRAGQRASGLAVYRLRALEDSAQQAKHRLVRLADQVRRRSRFLCPEHRHRWIARQPIRTAVHRLGRQPPRQARLQAAGRFRGQ